MDPRQFQIEYGGPAKPGVYDPSAAGWTDYHTLPEIVARLGKMLYQPYYFPGRFIRNFADYMSQSWEGNPSRFINPVDPEYKPSIYAEPSPTPSMDTGGVGGVFAGERALLGNLNMKKIAERALAAGKDPDEVRRVTGWFKGMEGKNKWEISDRDMRLGSRFESVAEMKDAIQRPGGEYLGDIIQHPTLFKNYPELNDVRVSTFYRGPSGSNAVFDGKNIQLAHDLTPEQAKDSILHEVQHWVQKKEGFARGGNTEMFRKKVEGELTDVHPALQERMMEKKYDTLAGEIEARDVSARRTWDVEMREAVPPTLREDAIIRWGDKEAEEVYRELMR